MSLVTSMYNEEINNTPSQGPGSGDNCISCPLNFSVKDPIVLVFKNRLPTPVF